MLRGSGFRAYNFTGLTFKPLTLTLTRLFNLADHAMRHQISFKAFWANEDIVRNIKWVQRSIMIRCAEALKLIAPVQTKKKEPHIAANSVLKTWQHVWNEHHKNEVSTHS